MRTYRTKAFYVLDQHALAAWIGRRIVARCATTRDAIRESELTPRVFYDLWKPPRSRWRSRIARKTFDRLFGAAVRLARAGGKAPPVMGELLPHILAPPARGLFAHRRKPVPAPAPRGGEIHDYERDARHLRERSDWTEAGIVELRGKTLSTELRPGDFYWVTSAIAEQQLVRKYGKGNLRWLRAAGKRCVALVAPPEKKRGRRTAARA